MRIADIMTQRIVTVDMDDTVKVIHDIFKQVKFHHILVINKNKHLQGVISDRDILKSLSPYLDTPSELPRDAATLRKHAHQVMTRHPVTIYDDETVMQGIHRFLEQSVSCLPVLNRDEEVQGILSWRDVFRAIAHQSDTKE
ncbi:MAG: CBS domain-containing protein [Gammaproteobacteria bacterium]